MSRPKGAGQSGGVPAAGGAPVGVGSELGSSGSLLAAARLRRGGRQLRPEGQLRRELAHDLGLRGGVVAGLEGIVRVIEELVLRGSVCAAGGDQAPAFGADRPLAFGPEAARRLGGRGGGAVKLRAQAAAVEPGGRGQPAEIGEGRKEIDGLDERRAADARLGQAGGADEKRGAERMLVEAMFAPDRVLSKEEPVVAPQDHDGAARGVQRLEGVEEAADLLVHVAHAGGVGAADLLGVGGIGVGVAAGVGVVAAELVAGVPGRGPVRLGGGGRGERGDPLRVVEIEVALRRRERQVRLEEADGEEPRIGRGGEFAELLHGRVGDPRVRVGGVGAGEGLERRGFPRGARDAVGVAVHHVFGFAPGGLGNPGAGPGAGEFIGPFGPEAAGAAAGVVRDLAEGVGAVAVLLEPTGQIGVAPGGVGGGDAAVAHVGGLARVATAEEGAPGGAAGGNLNVVMGEDARAGGESVEPRGPGVGHAHRTEVIAQIVHRDEENVRARGRRGVGRPGRQCNAEDGEDNLQSEGVGQGGPGRRVRVAHWLRPFFFRSSTFFAWRPDSSPVSGMPPAGLSSARAAARRRRAARAAGVSDPAGTGFSTKGASLRSKSSPA